MKRLSWTAITVVALAGTAGASTHATVGPQGPPERVDTSALPSQCRQFIPIPADSRSATLPWEQRLSLAACRQSFVIAPTSNPADYAEMMSRLDDRMQPSFDIYRDAFANGPTPQIRILGAYGLGMSHVASLIRARSAVHVPPEGAGAYAVNGTAVDRYQALHRPLETLLAGHRDAALDAFQKVARLADENPAAARSNPVMAYVVADARTQAALLERRSETIPNVSIR